MTLLGFVFGRPSVYRRALSFGRFISRKGSSDDWWHRLPGYPAGWTRGRDFPPIAPRTFREWWDERSSPPHRKPTSAASSGGGAASAPHPGFGGGAARVHDPGSGGGAATVPGPGSGGGRGDGGDPAAEAPRYRLQGDLNAVGRLDLLQRRLEDYRAHVTRCRPSELADTIRRRLEARSVGSLVTPYGLPDSWIPRDGRGSVTILTDGGPVILGKEELASADAVLSGCTLAIAETGTLILSGSPEEGRRALSLLPDYHLCVIRGDQVVETVPEAVRSLAKAVPPPPLTLISGPSATSDIELIRVEGVHGPRTLDVILVETP